MEEVTKEKQIAQQQQPERQAVIEINYYTDPLCCWSWAFEPQWRRLRYEYGAQLSCNYFMGGMIDDWKNYHDPMNMVGKPIQMGPLWMEARNISGMPINDNIWIHDFPYSSYPACIAVKCACLQSKEAGDIYLRKVREALMINGRNIAQLSVLLNIAENLNNQYAGLLDYKLFKDAYDGAGRDAFREDLRHVRYHHIERFPTLTMNEHGKPGVIITGYRPYEVLIQGLRRVNVDILPIRKINLENYKNYWGFLTDRELKEVQ